jgi:hypothetical protein
MGFVVISIVTRLVAGGGGAGTAELKASPLAKEFAAATPPATARNRLRLTFETSEFLNMKLSFTARF